jgi:hypothetical protein
MLETVSVKSMKHKTPPEKHRSLPATMPENGPSDWRFSGPLLSRALLSAIRLPVEQYDVEREGGK